MDELNINSVAVQTHITAVQGIINRIAANCASCKTWCVTLVSAIIVIGFDKEKGNPKYFLIATIPILLFIFLDAFYLSLEKVLRDKHGEFIEKITDSTVSQDEIKKIIFSFSNNKLRQKGKKIEGFVGVFSAMFSISVFPFYLLQIIMLLLIYCLFTK